MTLDTEGLHPISNTDVADRVADIVFVHGLGGGAHATWRYGTPGVPGHFFWPEELGKDLGHCGVWSLGYEAGIIPWFGADGLPIEDRAVNLAHKLTTQGLGTLPVIFITHSMGGLMVKEIVVQSLTAGDADWSRLVSQIAGIVFCGTPHRGSDVAWAGKKLAMVLRTQHHIRDMAAGTRHLDRLHTRFVEWHRQHQPRVEAYAEGIGMKRQRWFLRWLPAVFAVTQDSANPQLAGCRCIPCHCDHLALVKPPNARDDVYAGVLKFVHSTLSGLAERRRKSQAPPSSSPDAIRSIIIDILREEGILPAKP